MLWNYREIKKRKRALKVTKTSDLIALAPQNDPFYVGQSKQLALAKWFKSLWQKLGYNELGENEKVHIRRIYYRLVSAEEPFEMLDGTPFENTEKCWQDLNTATKYARYLGYVNPLCLVDRRAQAPEIYHIETEEEECAPFIAIAENDFDVSQIPDLPDLPSYYLENFQRSQKYHLEIWIEKSTMNDILEPLCKKYGANLVVGVGEISITQTRQLIERIKTYEKPCRIFYISDFDPAGQSMPVAVARKIEFFTRNINDVAFDIRLNHVMLTHEQVKKYKQPRTPIKQTEQRAKHFENQYGAGATELDALEALHPGEFKRILEEAISKYIDESLDDRVQAAKNKIEAKLESLEEDVYQSHEEELEKIVAEHEHIKTEVDIKLESLSAQIKTTYLAIQNDLDEVMVCHDGVTDADLPLPKPEGDIEISLYDSDRSYLEQIEQYKRFQGKPYTVKGMIRGRKKQ